MSGRPLIGLVCALLVEARHWVPWRWDFDDNGCARAWQLATLMTAMSAVLLMLEGSRYTALPDLLTWIPVLMIPVQFVQSYGMRPGIPLNAISYFARRHRLRAHRLGLPVESRMFHFGNVMFFLCLISASVGKDAGSQMFLPGIMVLCVWRVLASGLCRWHVLVPVVALAGLGGLAGEYGLRYLEERLGRGGSGRDGKFDPTFSHTMIGTAGEVVLSPEIQWRLRPMKGSVPPLLRNASFSVFVGNAWQLPRSPKRDFQDLDSRIIGEVAVYLTKPRNSQAPGAATIPTYEATILLPSFVLRGASQDGGPLPLPGDVAAVSSFELDGIEINSLGTVRVYPKDPVMNGLVYWKSGTYPEAPPRPEEDLRIPRSDQDTLGPLVEEIGLSTEDDVAVTLAKLMTWFRHEFQYSRTLTIGHRNSRGNDGSPISRFLSTVRSGHCEYFATGAALLLRQMGIPTRYATGFAVAERDARRGEFVLRGTHGHAWVRVWNGERWVDFDPTPPDWLGTGPPELTLTQRLEDFIKRLREDFFVWRTQPGKETLLAVIAGAVVLTLGGFVVARLWKSKSVIEKPAPGKVPHRATGLRTPLHDLESVARRMAGPRPPGEPYAAWVARVAAGRVEKARVSEAVALHQRMRFDPEQAAPDMHGRLDQIVRELRSALERG
jgi:transglutaminase-like putative cysteine protease